MFSPSLNKKRRYFEQIYILCTVDVSTTAMCHNVISKKLFWLLYKRKKDSSRMFSLKTNKKPSHNFITAGVHVGALTTMVVLSNDGV